MYRNKLTIGFATISVAALAIGGIQPVKLMQNITNRGKTILDKVDSIPQYVEWDTTCIPATMRLPKKEISYNTPDSLATDTTDTIDTIPYEALPYDTLDMGAIPTINLDELVVKGVLTPVIAKQDTLEFNAGAFKTIQNATVEDLLKKLPGVEVNSDGSISSGGKTISKILVDGKEFFADDPQLATKNLPSEMVEKVQVIDRKSDLARLTGIDDGDDETVINLSVKKSMNNGWFGNISAGYAPWGKDMKPVELPTGLVTAIRLLYSQGATTSTTWDSEIWVVAASTHSEATTEVC